MGYRFSLKGLSKRFGAHVVLDAVDLDIQPGELLTLLGPSGCGKTTLLRALAGFYPPDAGQIYANETDITSQPTHLRDMGMVFQNYAVFPHMTVAANVAYGLQARRCTPQDIRVRVSDALQKVQLGHLGERFPTELSGGQKQRVGLARALVINPTLLLMDEPLSNLDAKLRIEMRQEIRLLQRDLGITTLYVTHDQEEALAVSDRIAVMNAGVIAQLGTPQSIYGDPHQAFVMDFVGGCNWVQGVLEVNAHEVQLRTDGDHRLALEQVLPWPGAQHWNGRAVHLGIRLDAVTFSDDPSLPGWDHVRVELTTYLGTRLQYRVRTSQGALLVFDMACTVLAPSVQGPRSIRFNPLGACVFDAESGERLR
ncbi:ABC transporter ATP-binding protein [Rhodoferax sp.]|jgi:ABC-type Fe3+/spermidine/putrescine transport system ATPase subunit|uniref:ABC transporter ATP-binding protein n=1 Tax=Rhodoferax sp. TaxID=50421 RepID=UPI003784965B